MHPNTRRVVEAARAAGLDIEVRSFPEGTRTAAEAAAAIGVDVGQIVKSLVFEVDGEPVVVLLSGADQLDPAKLAEAAGGHAVTRPDADRVRAVTGFPIGGVAPLPHAEAVRLFADQNLLRFDVVWAAAGTWTDVFAAPPDELVRASGGTVGAFART